jgi:hypothetical protein
LKLKLRETSKKKENELNWVLNANKNIIGRIKATQVLEP